ncbi:hypothetical protein LAV82_23460 [Bacillus sp. ILBB4]|nr:hypothetical protein [Bacillus sp. ILBB4]
MGYTLDEKKAILKGLNIGDIVLLVDGREFEFVRMKQTKFIAKNRGVAYNVQLAAFKEVVRRVEQKQFDPGTLKQGDLVYTLDAQQNPVIYRYKYMINSNRMMAENPVTAGGVRIDMGLIKGSVKELEQQYATAQR